MSNTIQELEKQLEKAKEEKKEERVQIHLKEAKKQTGVGWASHSLNSYMNSKRPAFDFHMFWVHDAILTERDEIRYDITVLDFAKTGDDYRMNICKNNYYDEIPFYLGQSRYPITLEQLNTFKSSFIPKLETAMDELRFDYKGGRLISQGDYSKERSAYELMKEAGFEFMDLEKEHHKVWELLKWNHHPFVFNGFLTKTKTSFDIIRHIYTKMEKDAYAWGSSILERDLPRVEAMRTFYDKYKHLVE
jgi:hypothetical protein